MNDYMNNMIVWGNMTQWLAHRTHDQAIAGSIPVTAHAVAALEKQFIYIFLNPPICKIVNRHWAVEMY